MAFNMDKINELKVQIATKQITKEAQVNNACSIMNSQIITTINSEEFEDDLQKTLERIIQENPKGCKEYDDYKLNYSFSYGFLAEGGSLTTRFYLKIRDNIVTSIEKKFNIDMSRQELREYIYTTAPIDNLLLEIQKELTNKFTELHIKSIQCGAEDFPEMEDEIVYTNDNGYIYI